MERLDRIESYSSAKGTVLTIGTFDGVHIGHKKIINELVEEAKNKDLNACLLTFSP
ncbi:MAG: riboflavin biosynthesis protein RibF, partial [Flavobacteriaceae bacterium]